MSENMNNPIFDHWKLFDSENQRHAISGSFTIIRVTPEEESSPNYLPGWTGTYIVGRGPLPNPMDSLAIGRLLVSAPTLARENAELQEALKDLKKAITHIPGGTVIALCNLRSTTRKLLARNEKSEAANG